MSWTDKDIDKLFQDSAGKASFEYKPEYWEELSASLPVSASVSNMTDEEVDSLFKADAENIAIAYKPEYWEEFAASLPLIIPTEEVSDAEVDELYRESAQQLSFKYKHAYWEEMAALLRSRRRPDFLWFGFSGIFAVALIYGMLSPQAPLGADMDFLSDLTQNIQPTQSQSFTAQNAGGVGNDIKTQEGHTTASNASIANEPNASKLNADIAASNKANVNGSSNERTINLANNEPLASTNKTNKKKRAFTPTVNAQAVISPTTRKSKFDDTPSYLETRTLLTEVETGTLVPWSPPGVKDDALFGVYVQGFGGISQSSITPSEFISNSYGIGAGFLVNKRNWTFSFGSNVVVENYSDLLLTRSAKVYGFGSDLYKYDLLYKHLYIAELDLSVGYNLGRHRFNLGLRPSFAFSSEVDINETSVTSSQGELIENEESRTKVYGFMEGVNRFGIKPMIGYAYNFKGNWTLGANFGVELLPAIKEEFINGTNNRAPLDGQLYIRKNFNLRK